MHPKTNIGFSVQEILEATGGELLSGSREGLFSGVSIDSRIVKDGEIFIAVKGEHFDGHDFIPQAVQNGAHCIIISKDKAVMLGNKIPHTLISVRDTISALSGLAYFHRKRFGIPVIGITGSNGKTTTKEMLGSLLSSRYRVLTNEGTQNNIIGLSLTLLNLRPEHEIAVLELGTNHFGELKTLTAIAAPNVGIITNIGPAHLEYFGDKNGVLKEKWQLLEELSSPRLAILNADDELLMEGAHRASSDSDITSFTFGIKNKADFMARRIRLSLVRNKLLFLIKNKPIELNTLSSINVYNALAAYAAARVFSIDAYDIVGQFRKTKFPKSRFQIRRANGLSVIDDAYNANPESFHYAIEAFKDLRASGRKIVVMADMLELGRQTENLHRFLGEELTRSGIDMIVAVGPLSHIACDAAVASGFNPRAAYKCSSNQEAKKMISDLATNQDMILVKGSRAMRLEEIFDP